VAEAAEFGGPKRASNVAVHAEMRQISVDL
jgi:hypothetical protein